MPSRLNAPDVRLDHIHSEAVWQSIGERLRDTLREEPDIPQCLRTLMVRLPELDRESAPPLVPKLAR